MKRVLFGLLVIILGTVFLAGILYSIFVDSNFVFDWWRRLRGQEPAPVLSVDPADQGSPADPTASEPKEFPANDINQAPETEVLPVEPDELAEKRANISSQKDTLLRMSRSFAERFGSYSNHSNFSNIETLKVFMTKSMQAWADNYVAQAKKMPRDDENYYGITTKAVSEEFLSYDEDLGQSRVLVITRRKEALGSTANQGDSITQEIEIELKKENGLWKVNGAYWK